MKTHARAIVIGGGIAECSLLYHLTKLGWKDVVLLEKCVLTAGSTWHSAGLCTMFSGSLRLMKLLRYSVDLYRRLEGEVGQHMGFKPVGSLRLATSQDYEDWFQHVGAIAQSVGIPFELVDRKEAARLSPLTCEDGILSAAVMPADGYVDPSGVTQALAKGAKQGGAEIYENARVREISLLPSGEWRVVSDQRSGHDYGRRRGECGGAVGARGRKACGGRTADCADTAPVRCLGDWTDGQARS